MNEIGIIVLLSPQLSVSSSQMDVFIMNRHIPFLVDQYFFDPIIFIILSRQNFSR